MSGKAFIIAKRVIKLLLITFHENDFINIIYFNASEVKFLIPCHTGLMQASASNKNQLLRALEKIPKPYGESEAHKGFKKAFDVIRNGSAASMSSNDCSKMIMFISDGIENDSKLDKVLEEDNANKTIKIFSFLVGIPRYETELKKVDASYPGKLIKVQTEGRHVIIHNS